VIPSFQQGRFLERTLQSLFEQGDPLLEILVMDGGSTDESVGIIQRYESKLCYWQSQPDGGQTNAINAGLGRATGDILGYLNSDDILMPGALKRIREAFEQNPAKRWGYGRAYHVDEGDKPFEEYPVEPWNFPNLLERCFICQPACFWSRAAWEEAGPMDIGFQYAMDYEYWCRLGSMGWEPFFIEGEALAGSRLYGENKTLGQRLACHRDSLRAVLRHAPDRFPESWVRHVAHFAAEETFPVDHHSDDPRRIRLFCLQLLRVLEEYQLKPSASLIEEMDHWTSGYFSQVS